MVTDHSPYIPKGNPFFLLSLTPNPYIYLLSNASVFLFWSSYSSRRCADHSIMGLFPPLGSVWLEGPGCFASSSHWASNISFSFPSRGAGAAMQSFIYILHLIPPTCCFQQGAVSKIQQDFTSPTTRMYPSAFLFSVSQMFASRAELVSHISGVNWDWKGLVSIWPYLSLGCCVLVWTECAKKDIGKLEKIQKKFPRVQKLLWEERLKEMDWFSTEKRKIENRQFNALQMHLIS